MSNARPTPFTVDFIGIGAPKCGTEWLIACLKEHPSVDFSKHKEIHYFLSPTQGLSNTVYENKRTTSMKAYQAEFAYTPDTIRGEFSNHYIFDLAGLRKIAQAFPDVKIVVSFRDPIRYLHSIFWYLKYSNAYHLLPNTLEEALETAHPDDLFHISHAQWGRMLQDVYSVFGKDNVEVILLDDIKKDPEKVMKDLFSFLQIDSSFTPTMLHQRINPTRQIRSPGLMRFTNAILRTLTKIGLGSIINYLLNTDTPLKKIYKKLAHTQQPYPSLSPKTEHKLRQMLRDDIELLEKLLERSLPQWK